MEAVCGADPAAASSVGREVRRVGREVRPAARADSAADRAVPRADRADSSADRESSTVGQRAATAPATSAGVGDVRSDLRGHVLPTASETPGAVRPVGTGDAVPASAATPASATMPADAPGWMTAAGQAVIADPDAARLAPVAASGRGPGSRDRRIAAHAPTAGRRVPDSSGATALRYGAPRMRRPSTKGRS
jgi:hypothetical protein